MLLPNPEEFLQLLLEAVDVWSTAMRSHLFVAICISWHHPVG